MSPLRRLVPLLVCLLVLARPSLGWAFKLDTHVWIGQQVINDLEDGRLTFVFPAGGGQPAKTVTIAVSPALRDAILANRQSFLVGNIGPDAMPDVVVGQMFPHPGLPTKPPNVGWKANDWLRYLSTTAKNTNDPALTAYTYGYLGHAASDVWAHSYVNQYAGGIFLLSDFETITEQRHAAIEGYIALRQPDPITNASGSPLGKPYQLVALSDALAARLRDTLIYAPAAQDQYRQAWFGAHMVAFKRYRDGIDRAAESTVWNKIDLAVAKYFVSEYTGYLMSDAEAQALIDEVQRLNNKLNQGIDLTQDEINSLNARLARIDKRFSTTVQNDVNRLGSFENDFLSAKASYEQLVLEKACEQVDLVCPNLLVPNPLDPLRPCPSLTNPFRMCGGSMISVEDTACRSAFSLTCRTTSTLTSLKNQALSNLVNQRSRLANELLGLFNDLSQSRADALQVANALIDLQQITTSGSPVQELLRNWRTDTDRAFADYVKASTQSMINTMDPNASAFAPIQQWVDCQGAALQGVPYVVSNCGNLQALQRLTNTLNRLSNLPANTVAVSIGLPTTTEVNTLISKVKADAVDSLKDSVKKGLIGLLPAEHQNYVRILDQGTVQPSMLTTAFTTPESAPYNLLMIGDVVGRVDREMGLINGRFKTDHFAPVVNAVTLSKLALLDATGIAALAAAANVSSTSFAGLDNLVIDSMASLDGNHQWLDQAPPAPRKPGTDRTIRWKNWDTETGVGSYPKPRGYASAAGFPLYSDVAVAGYSSPRRGIFLKLFKGPLNTGIEQPAELCDYGNPNQFPRLLESTYEYRTCVRNPYPAVLWDGTPATDPCPVLGTYVDPNAPEPIPDPTCPGCGKN